MKESESNFTDVKKNPHKTVARVDRKFSTAVTPSLVKRFERLQKKKELCLRTSIKTNDERRR